MRRLVLCVVSGILCSGLTPRSQSHSDEARLPGQAYGDIVALQAAGRPRDALTALARRAGGTDGDTPIEALVLRARLLSDAGEHLESAELWQEAGARAEEIAPVALRAAADNLVRAGDPARAEAVLAGWSARRHGDTLTAVAAGYRRRGEPRRAAALYRQIIAGRPGGQVADEAALGLAAAIEETGDGSAALDLLIDLQLRFRQGPTFARARAESVRLARQLGRTAGPFTDAQYRTLANRLLDLSRFDETLEVLEEWRRAFPQSVASAEAQTIDTLYRARRDAEARARAEAYLARHPDSPQAVDVRVILYRLDVREGRTADVRARGEALWTGRVPGVVPADRLSLGRLLAAYLVSVGELDEGLRVYGNVYRASTAREMRIDLMWRIGVAAIRAGRLDRADANLRALRRQSLGRDVSLLVEYWTAALAERRGRGEDAVRLFAALARREPYEYYGIRAGERLVALGAAVPHPEIRRTFPPAMVQPATRARPEFRGAELLARAGLIDEASAMARELAGALPGDQGLALLAARALAAAGDHRRAVELVESRFAGFLEEPAEGVPPDFWEIAYPKAFRNEVWQAAEAAAVDPLLLLSLARQESRFAPSARSAAGALGLFQIMPSTADAVGPRVGLDVADRSVILRPDANATLAAGVLSDSMRLFGDAEVPAVAAYNAGDARTLSWWTAARKIPEDLFVDTIPYSETRNYVRLVYTNAVRYRTLYGRSF